jgi:PAS domain S-box-containing protein
MSLPHSDPLLQEVKPRAFNAATTPVAPSLPLHPANPSLSILPAKAAPLSPGWLLDNGEMSERIVAHPWTDTVFGELETWPAPLRFAVNLMLGASSPMAIVWGPDSHFLYNDRYAALIQDKHPRALGARAAEIFPEVWSEIAPLFHRTFKGEAVDLDRLVLPLRRRGQTATASFCGSYNPIHDERRTVLGFLATVVETTAHVALAGEKTQLLETFLFAIADFVFTFDRRGRFRYANKALLDQWEIPLDQAIGKTLLELNFPPVVAEQLERHIQEVFDRKVTVRDEMFFVSLQGKPGVYEYILSPVLDGKGSVSMVAGSGREVSNQRKLERELREVHRRMATALTAGEMGTWTWDIENDRIHADPNVARFFSVSKEDANGGPLASYLRAVHHEDRDLFASRFARAFETGSNYEVEYRLLDRTGEVRWVSSRGLVELGTQGRPTVMPGIVLDITARKKLEAEVWQTIQQLESAKHQLQTQAGSLEKQVAERTARLQETISELETFSYSISHDLRGPLRVMQSFAEALREDCGEELSSVGKDYVRRVISAAERMDRIIQDVLVYSRIVRIDLPLEPIALEQFVTSLLEAYPAFQDDDPDIAIEGRLPTVMANAAALTQTLANLIGNAAKFVAPGVKPIVRIFAREENGRSFVSVRDNGVGIPAGVQDAIFGIFYRLDPSYEGTGIGLAIVRKAVERMGGKIVVVSQVDRGSTFTFDLGLASPA